jgi:DNA modification methylase
MSVQILQGDVRAMLATLPDASVQCVVTSPPYYGLRAYGTSPQVWGGDPEHAHEWAALPYKPQRDGGKGFVDGGKVKLTEYKGVAYTAPSDGCPCGAWRGELGSEPTPSLFIEHLVSIFDEVRRVMRPDAVLWVNLGDSYSGSGKGPTGKSGIGDQGQRQGFVGSGARSYGRSGTAPRGYRGDGSSSSNLCDGCREALTSDSARTDSQPAPESTACEADPIPGHTESRCPSPDSSGSLAPSTNGQSCLATLDLPQTQDLEGEPPPASRESNSGESAQPLPGGCSHCSNCDACLAVLRSSSRESRLCVRGLADYMQCTSEPSGSSADRNQGKGLSYTASGRPPYVQEQYTMPPAKSLLLIPERFAIAMQDAGWIVRSRIAWCKTSAMPESVRDRPTSAWEHIWMFTRSAKYFWDQEAVRQPAEYGRRSAFRSNRYLNNHAFNNSAAHEASPTVSGKSDDPTANLRNYWLLGPEPSREQHYAAYPSEIPRRCILAATSEKGQCVACGVPWVRVVERTQYAPQVVPAGSRNVDESRGDKVRKLSGADYNASVKTLSERWQAGCQCDAGDPVPQLVLDPFAGSFTTGAKLGCD